MINLLSISRRGGGSFQIDRMKIVLQIRSKGRIIWGVLNDNFFFILKAGGYVMRSLLLGTMNVMIRKFLEFGHTNLKKNVIQKI